MDNIYPSSDYKLNPYYLFHYSFIQQHAIGGIRNKLCENDVLEIAHYPTTIASGYAAYLNPNRKTYWRDYANAMWDTHVISHVIFNFDFESFYKDFENKLTSIWEEALRIATKESRVQKEITITVPKKFSIFKTIKTPEATVMIDAPIPAIL